MRDKKYFFHFFDTGSSNIFFCLIPNDYKVLWAASPKVIVDSVLQWHDRYWTKNRIQLAERIGLSIPEIITLASIVQSESLIFSERQKIARVYLNRIKSNMPLQADPTLIFANRLKGVKRILDIDKKINSPYNTYINTGLPPGPISLTYTTSIESVLNAENHSFLFFCAKPERNGYSNFSSTYNEHLKHAKNYQTALNKQKIFR